MKGITTSPFLCLFYQFPHQSLTPCPPDRTSSLDLPVAKVDPVGQPPRWAAEVQVDFRGSFRGILMPGFAWKKDDICAGPTRIGWTFPIGFSMRWFLEKNRWVLGMGAGLSCGNPCGFWVGSFLFVFLLKVNLKFTRNSDFLALAGKNSRFSKTRTITPHTSFRLLSRQTLLCCVRQLNKHMLVIIAVRPLACMQILGGWIYILSILPPIPSYYNHGMDAVVVFSLQALVASLWAATGWKDKNGCSSGPKVV